MQQKRAFKHGRVVPLLAAGLVGYLLGSLHTVGIRSAGLSAAEAVAMRFPEDLANTTTAEVAPATSGAPLVGDQRLALLDPQPMVPRSVTPQAVAPQAMPQASLTNAALDAAPSAVPQPIPAINVVKPVPAAPHHVANRPGFLLNDAQIASIKQRLRLTPDQEEMWPAVEAALRNIAYTQSREAHRHGAPVNAAQLASADPNSVEVQGLKSAAIPLLMSFNDEQKDEVRNLAHVMGLDQLASQF
jgi:hypothetical protein